MNDVHQRVADSIKSVAKQIESDHVIAPIHIMPVGFDGAVIYHLLRNHWKKQGYKIKDDLDKTVQISSRNGEFDENKFRNVVEEFTGWSELYALDLRTKTGYLGRMIKKCAGNCKAKNPGDFGVKYVALFDHNNNADLRGSEEDFTVTDRQDLCWVPGYEIVDKYIKEVGGKWRYNLTHQKISKFDHVAEVKKLI